MREVEWDQDMNQSQLEPGNLCHEYLCSLLHHSSSRHVYFPFSDFNQQFISKQKTKCCVHSLTLFCLYLHSKSRCVYLRVQLRKFHVSNRHSEALYTLNAPFVCPTHGHVKSAGCRCLCVYVRMYMICLPNTCL